MHFPVALLPILILFECILAVQPDQYMVCSGPVPSVEEYGEWPYGYSPAQYLTNLQLCSSYYGNAEPDGTRRNVGCRCLFPNQPLLWCNPRNSDRTLFYWDGLNEDWTFPSLCQQRLCQCTSANTRDSYEVRGLLGNATFTYDQLGMGEVTGVLPYGADEHSSDISTDDEDSGVLSAPESLPANETCGGACTAATGCGAANNQSNYDEPQACQCVSQAMTVIPGNVGPAFANVIHLMACGLIGVSLGGKRDEPDLCACNATYVSHGCCGAVDGMVWEAPEAYRGIVFTPDMDLEL